MVAVPDGERAGHSVVAGGIALCLTAYLCYVALDATVKVLGGRYHVAQVMFLNSLFALLVSVLIAAVRGNTARIASPQIRLHFLRWSISLPGGLAIFWCYSTMPLADVYAILFTAPLFQTALSVPVLGEQVGWRRWTAVLVGFAGVLVMLDPGKGIFAISTVLALMGALTHASNMMFLRKMRGIDPPEVFGVLGSFFSVAALAPVMPLLWITPTPEHLGAHALAGTIAGSAGLLLVLAYARVPVAVLAPFQYLQMVYGVLVGMLFFNDWPTVRMLVGAVIVIASGLYILRRETLKAREALS